MKRGNRKNMRKAIEEERKEISHSQTKMTEDTMIPKWKECKLDKEHVHVRTYDIHLPQNRCSLTQRIERQIQPTCSPFLRDRQHGSQERLVRFCRNLHDTNGNNGCSWSFFVIIEVPSSLLVNGIKCHLHILIPFPLLYSGYLNILYLENSTRDRLVLLLYLCWFYSTAPLQQPSGKGDAVESDTVNN